LQDAAAHAQDGAVAAGEGRKGRLVAMAGEAVQELAVGRVAHPGVTFPVGSISL
jgi:hypothetical protein